MPNHEEQDKINDINNFMFKDLKKSESPQPLSSNQQQSAENDSELRILIQDIIIDNFDSESLNRTAFNSSVDILTAVDSHYRLRCQSLEEENEMRANGLNDAIECISNQANQIESLTAHNQQMREENERMKESLNKIDNLIGNYMHNDWVKIGTLLLDIQEIAVKT